MAFAVENAQPERDAERKHAENLPAETPAGLSTPLLGAFLGGMTGDAAAPSDRSPSHLSHPANGEMRAYAMRRAQQSLGNHRSQQLVLRMRRAAPVVQRQCACGGTCAACQDKQLEEEDQKLIQRQLAPGAAGEPEPGETMGSAEVIPADSPGQPLPEPTRKLLEARLRGNFSEVRVHTDGRAAESAEALEADAYTSGRDIYFARGKYAPESPAGQTLLAHELTHVQQQAAGQAPTQTDATSDAAVRIGSPTDPLEREAEARAETGGEPGTGPEVVTPDASPTVRRAGWNSVTDNPLANRIASSVRKGADFVASQIERFAPGAVAFFRNARDFFKNAIPRAVDGVFGGIVSSLREKGLVGTLETMIGSIAAGAVNAIGGFASGQCAAMGKLAEYLVDIAAKLGGAVLEQVRKGFDFVRATFEDLWTEYGAPAVDWIKKKLKGIWKEVEDTASKIWKLLKPLREGLAAIWDEVTSFLIESRRGFNEWLEWLLPKAIDAWEEVKAKLKPYMEHVKTAAKVIAAAALLLSPAGPFVVLGVAIYALYRGAKELWEKWGKEKVRAIRQWWVDQGLPFVRAQLKELRTKVEALKQRVQAGLQQVAEVFTNLLRALGVHAFLSTVRNAINSVALKIEAFRDKLHQQIEQWSEKLRQLAAQAEPFLQKIQEAFRQSLLVATFGPFAFLDDGVWTTLNRFVSLVMRTPCLREIAGLLRVPASLERLGRVRAGIKEGLEVIKNPDPLLNKFKSAIAPLVTKIEPEIRSRVEALSDAYTEREQMIQVSIWHYLANSLAELRDHWWEQLKKIGGDLLWPWPEVAKDFMPMLEDFGSAISLAFDLEFSQATDKFLSGMRKFNGIAGALSGWFLVASVLIGAALGALGFAFGPAGVATVGAGASAGLAFAEEVGMGLLVVAVATEAGIIAKAWFDLKFQNPRVADVRKREEDDQEDCKAIAGSLISLVTIGALMLLADIASKFAKFLYSLVEDVPIVRDLSALLKDAKKSVSEFGLKEKPGARAEAPVEAPGVPREPGAPAEKLPEETPSIAEEKGVPKERLDAEVGELRQKAASPDNVRRPADPRFDAELDAQGHTYDRNASDHTWCRFSDPACGLDLGSDLNGKVDSALQEKPVEPVKPEPTEAPGPATEEPRTGAELKEPADPKRAELERDLADVRQRKIEAEKRWNERRKAADDLSARAKALRDRAFNERNPDLHRQAKALEDAASQARRDAEIARQETISAQLEAQKKSLQLNTDLQSALPCFALGTPVATPFGPTAIDLLKPGDFVLSHSFEAGVKVVRRVLKVLRNKTLRFYCLSLGGQEVRATSLHRFWVNSEAQWVEARHLCTGMELLSSSGQGYRIDAVRVEECPDAPTFNLHIEQTSNYFVGPGVLVHNAGSPAYNFGKLRIYEGVNPKFPDKIYIGQTDSLDRRQGEHRAEAEAKLQDPTLSPEQREFWEFKRDIVLKERVGGLNPDQANYLEQKNMELEAKIRGEKNVVNRREQVSRRRLAELEQNIKADPAVQEAGLCP